MIDFDSRDLYDLKCDIDNIKDAKRQDFGYREIDVDDLPFEDISEDERYSIERHRKEKNIESLIIYGIVLFFDVILILRLIFGKNSETAIAQFVYWQAIVIIIGLPSYIFKKKLTAVKHGIVCNKYEQIDRIKKTKNYYLDIAFPDNETVIRSVPCDSLEYVCADEGSTYLVFVFRKRFTHKLAYLGVVRYYTEKELKELDLI